MPIGMKGLRMCLLRDVIAGSWATIHRLAQLLVLVTSTLNKALVDLIKTENRGSRMKRHSFHSQAPQVHNCEQMHLRSSLQGGYEITEQCYPKFLVSGRAGPNIESLYVSTVLSITAPYNITPESCLFLTDNIVNESGDASDYELSGNFC